jgi:putative Holliday junction resolvase
MPTRDADMADVARADYKGAMQDDKPQSDGGGERPSASSGAKALDIGEFRSALRPGERLIGIDVGTKTLGIALSDVGRTIASGLETIRRKKFTPDAGYLLELAAKHGVGGLVIGLPLNLDGSEGPRAQGTRAFQRNLARMTALPMLFWDERLSTAAAERTLIESDASRRRRAEVIDKMAATIILQIALDRMKRE